MDVLQRSEPFNPIVAGGSETHTPYGVLRSHNAICVGNATTFKLFMDALDIPCKIIHSTQNGEHAWDVVQLDGEWYHVDVTFDGGVSGEPGYNYFNMPDSVKDNGSYRGTTTKFLPQTGRNTATCLQARRHLMTCTKFLQSSSKQSTGTKPC